MNENRPLYYVIPKQSAKKFSTKKELIDYLSKNSSHKSIVIKGKEGTVEVSNKPIINVNF